MDKFEGMKGEQRCEFTRHQGWNGLVRVLVDDILNTTDIEAEFIWRFNNYTIRKVYFWTKLNIT